MSRKSGVLSLAFVLTLICIHAGAVPRPASPQLAGIKRVVLALDLPDFPPEAETEPMRKEITARLAKAGIRVEESAPMMLVIRVKRRETPACAELAMLRGSIALLEEVRLRRNEGGLLARVSSWSWEQEFEHASPRRPEAVRDSVMQVVKVFVDEVGYAATWGKRSSSSP